MTTLQDLLNSLARRLESGPLHMDANHPCRLMVDELELTIELLEKQGILFTYIVVGPLPAAHRENMLTALMEENLFHYGTGGGAIFGLDKEVDEVLLHQRFDLQRIDEANFISSCIQMIEVAKVWKENLLQSNSGSPSIVSTPLSIRGLSLNMDGRKE